MFRIRPHHYLAALLVALAVSLPAAWACDFCGPVNLTLSEDINSNQIGIIVTLVKRPRPKEEGSNELTKAVFRVDHVLKGAEHLATEKKDVFTPVEALYFGDKPEGVQFLILGIDPPKTKWGGPLALTSRGVEYVLKLMKLPEKGGDRLAYFQEFLEDADSILARDAYDEFARAPYEEFKELKPRMHHDRLLKWIKDDKLPRSRKRLYLMMLSVCGKPEDTKMLADMLTEVPDPDELRIGIEPIIIAYLMLSGPVGMDLIDKHFMANQKASYTDTYSAIMALRFMGQEEKVIPRKRILQSFYHILDRADYADLVIPDLARWEDWTVMPRLVKLFKETKDESAWVRVPVVQYLMACPKPEAKKHIAELKKIDPDAIKRASFILPLTRPRGKDKKPAPAPAPAPAPKKKADAKKADAKEKKGLKKAEPAADGGPVLKEASARLPARTRPTPRDDVRQDATDFLTRRFWFSASLAGGIGLIVFGLLWARRRRETDHA